MNNASDAQRSVIVGPFTEDFHCDCGRPIKLWWNGGELDHVTCECGIEWSGQHMETVLIKTTPERPQVS